MNKYNKINIDILGCVATAIVIIIFFLSRNYPFFWDTLLTSSVLQHYENFGIGNLILPIHLDAGHPPFFYLYLFGFVKLFGLNLFSVHVAMLPILIVLVWSFLSLLTYFNFCFKEKLLALILLFSIPAVLTQSLLISYDIVILSFSLAVLYFGLSNRFFLFTFFSILLCGVSVRGGIALCSIFFILIYLNNSKKNIYRLVVCLLLVFILNVLWYSYHQSEAGFLFSGNHTWRSHRNFADISTIFKNIISIGRKLFDFGIIILFIINIISIKINYISKKIFIWLIPFAIFSLSFVFFTNPIGHRYYLFIYVLMLLPAVKFLADKNIFYSLLLIICLVVSHFQIYTNPISNGWDCTLAHYFYFDGRKELDNIIYRKGIEYKNIATYFPLAASNFQMYWKGNQQKMKEIQNFSDCDYVLYSNVSNDFPDDFVKNLDNFKVVWKSEHSVCKMILYENKKLRIENVQ